MFSIIVDIAMKIVDYVRDNNKLKRQERENLSDVFRDISEIILDTAVKLKNNQYPHNNCVVLEKLANNLHLHLIDYADQDELDKLHGLLKDASEIEKLYTYRHNEDMVRDLMKISGEFRAMSILLMT